jgi:hypothetical protein
MKSDEEIMKVVEKTKLLVQKIYEKDPRILDPKQQQPGSGVVEETKIVFKEVLRYLLKN